MSSKQRQVLSLFVFLNLIVYATLGYLAYVYLPAQPRPRATEITLKPLEPATTEPIDPLDIRPADTLTPGTTNTPLPWEQGGAWWSTPTATATNSPTLTPTPFTRGSTSRQVSQRVVATVTVIAQPPAVSYSGGDSASNPIPAGDAWRLLSPGASAWYKIGKGGDHMDVFLDSSDLLGMSLQVFAPGNLDQPIGQGSLEGGRRVWAGGKWNSTSDWLARVTNNNPKTVSYRLMSYTREIGVCDSTSYWEYIGKNLVYWTRCK